MSPTGRFPRLSNESHLLEVISLNSLASKDKAVRRTIPSSPLCSRSSCPKSVSRCPQKSGTAGFGMIRRRVG